MTGRQQQALGVVLIVLVLVSGAKSLRAEEPGGVHPYLGQKFFVDLGVYFPIREVTLSVNGTVVGRDQRIDFEEQLGLKKHDETFALNFGWRFAKKWQLETQYFASSGRTQNVLDEDVVWNDIVFGAGTGVAAGQDFSVARVFFARRFSNNADTEFGLGLGIHWLEFGAFIEGNAIINGGANVFRKQSVSADAPLPNIGVWYIHSFSPKWAFKGRLDWFSADVGNYGGTLINASAGVNRQVFEHIGLGVSYNYFGLDIGVHKSGWRGDLDTNYGGPFVYFNVFW